MRKNFIIKVLLFIVGIIILIISVLLILVGDFLQGLAGSNISSLGLYCPLIALSIICFIYAFKK